MASLRIEFEERFLDMTDEEIDRAENLKQELTYSYRRVYPRLSDIAYPMEMKKAKKHCEIMFKDNASIIVKGTYQDICLAIDAREQMDEEGEERLKYSDRD